MKTVGTLLKTTLLHSFFKFYNEAYNQIALYTTYLLTKFEFPSSIDIYKVTPELRIQSYIDTISSLPPMLLVDTIHYLLVQDI